MTRWLSLFLTLLAASAFGYHADRSGNSTALVNVNQLIVGKYLYDPFGNLLVTKLFGIVKLAELAS